MFATTFHVKVIKLSVCLKQILSSWASIPTTIVDHAKVATGVLENRTFE
jgi:hypothetical protein